MLDAFHIVKLAGDAPGIEEAVRSMIAAYGEALDKVEVPARLTSINVRGRDIDLRPWLRERYQRLSVSLLS